MSIIVQIKKKLSCNPFLIRIILLLPRVAYIKKKKKNTICYSHSKPPKFLWIFFLWNRTCNKCCWVLNNPEHSFKVNTKLNSICFHTITHACWVAKSGRRRGRWKLLEMNGCYNGCWHDHCTLNRGILRKGKTTCATYTHTIKYHFYWGVYESVWDLPASIWDLPAFMHRIVCPLAFSSPPQSAIILTVWLFSEIHSHKWNSAPYSALKVLHACFHLSVRSLPFGLVVQQAL